MARAKKERHLNCNTQTEAEKKRMIINAIRQLSVYWKPMALCLKQSKRGVIESNWYLVDKINNTEYDKKGKKHTKKNKDNHYKKMEDKDSLKIFGYECSCCHALYPEGMMRADHILPAVPVTGFEGYDSFIERLFVEVDGYQALCEFCHSDKTLEENELRKKHRKDKKENNSDDDDYLS